MSQTSVTQQGLPPDGMKADSGNDYVASKLAEGTIAFGRFVCLGTDPDQQAKLPALAGDITSFNKNIGVALHSHAIESASSGLPQYPDKSVISAIMRGRVYVSPEQDVLPTDPVYVRFAARKERYTIVFDADLITGNTVEGEIAGVSISVPFNTDHATTMADLETAVEAVPGVLSATVGGSGNRTLTVVSDADTELEYGEFEVTGGASQAGVVVTKVAYMATADEAGRFCKDASLDESAAATAAALPNSAFVYSALAETPVVLELGK